MCVGRKCIFMTVKEEISLRLSGVTSAEIKDLKEREKLEKENGEDDAKDEAKEKDEAKDEAEEKAKDEAKDKKAKDEAEDEAKDTEKEKEIEELKAQILKLQNDKSHADFSDNVDNRSDFDKCVDIFKNAY